MRRSITAALLAAALAACSIEESSAPAPAAASDASPAVLSPGGALDDIMKAKLVHAHALLEAIALGSFRQIEHQANELVFLSDLTEWQVHRTDAYLAHSDAFRAAAARLAAHARAEDLVAVSADYVDLTDACVRCHDYLRDAGLAEVTPSS